MKTARLKKTTGRKLLRPRQIATYFGVTISTVRRWVNEGRLTAIFTPGGHSRIVADEFLASYIADKNVQEIEK